MKYNLILLFLLIPVFVFGQDNTKKGLAVEGYDVVSYFDNQPAKGSAKFESTHDGVKYQFSSAKNKEVFTQNPENYIPEYGGWCAYAMGVKGDKVDIDPETYEIRDGKLYLFYNRFFTNTLDSWIDEDPVKLIPLADKNWTKLKKK